MTCIHNYIRERDMDPCSRTLWVCCKCSCAVYNLPTGESNTGEHTVIHGRLCEICCVHDYKLKTSPYGGYLECIKCEHTQFD